MLSTSGYIWCGYPGANEHTV